METSYLFNLTMDFLHNMKKMQQYKETIAKDKKKMLGRDSHTWRMKLEDLWRSVLFVFMDSYRDIKQLLGKKTYRVNYPLDSLQAP